MHICRYGQVPKRFGSVLSATGSGSYGPSSNPGRWAFLTDFRRARFMTMLGISGVELPDRRTHPVSSLRLGDPPP